MSCVYVLLCEKDNSFYIVSTRNILERIKSHKNGEVKYTKNRLPVKLMFLKEFTSYAEAFAFEKRVKSWKKRKSILAMINKDDNIVLRYTKSI